MAFEIKKSKYVFVKVLSINHRQKIKGDVNFLVQVLNNIITNVIEASKEGNIITLGAYKDEKKLIFYIRNSGQRISEEIQRKYLIK